MDFYKKHIFFCTNVKSDDRKCCSQGDAVTMLHHAKEKLKFLGLFGEGKVRVSSAGCMGRCQQGPAMVIYPDSVWYTYSSIADIDEIIESHILNGVPVERLLIDPSK